MSDVTTAPEQDAIADSLVSEEPQEQQAVEAPEAEQQQVETEVTEQVAEQQTQ